MAPRRRRILWESSVSETNNAIFISYAKQDAQAAARICAALREAGMEVWFDQSELRGGDAWDAAIRRQIKTCALVIPIISSHTQGRAEGYFRLEWKLAIDRSHLMAQDRPFLIPVVIDDTLEGDQRVPDKFNEVQWTRLPHGVTTPAFVDRMARLLGQATGSTISPAPTAKPAALTPEQSLGSPTEAPPSKQRSPLVWLPAGSPRAARGVSRAAASRCGYMGDTARLASSGSDRPLLS